MTPELQPDVPAEVIRRDRNPRPQDVEAIVRWATVETAWEDWDAPWERSPPLAAEQVE